MLYDKLKNYASGDTYPMHMPGHKRNPGFMPAKSFAGLPYDIDITEINGFDDLHNPQGILLETSELAANLYGSRESFMLVNGSTVGILSAIGALTGRGDKVLADRNCHRSVPNAARLFDLILTFLTSGIDESSGVSYSITPATVRSALQDNPDIKLVIITSPSYEGVVSDIEAIADITHKAGALLFVDCAHGAHFGFFDGFPESPIKLGADIVVVSLHKTLPALTQCSLLHICSDRVDADSVKQMLDILQTSSPSYVLMASIDHCLHLLQSDADRLFREYADNLAYFLGRVRNLRTLFALRQKDGFFSLDPGKIVLVTKGSKMDGMELSSILRDKYKIELERACADYAIAMTSICDTREGFTRLADALIEMDGLLAV